MSSDKKLSPIETLEQKHREASEVRKVAIEAATKDMRDYEALRKEAAEKVRQLQAENMRASFAFDAERALLVAEADKSRAA